MHEQTRYELSTQRPVSRDPGPLDLTAPAPPLREAEPLTAVEKMGYLGKTVFAGDEIPLSVPQPLPTFSELIAQAYRLPSPGIQSMLHTMVEAPGLDTAARSFVEDEQQWEASH
ncbi:MAG TPA: hypothetical protein VFI84_03455 [Candidatus Saccharimonadales bacterium]|nr:hypothetical protein [Candidatus Saccharimonadales bacterium]